MNLRWLSKFPETSELQRLCGKGREVLQLTLDRALNPPSTLRHPAPCVVQMTERPYIEKASTRPDRPALGALPQRDFQRVWAQALGCEV